MTPPILLPAPLAALFAHIEVEEVEPGHWHGKGTLPGLGEGQQTFEGCIRLAKDSEIGPGQPLTAREAAAIFRAQGIKEGGFGARVKGFPTPLPDELLLVLCGASWMRVVLTVGPWSGTGPMKIRPWLRSNRFGAETVIPWEGTASVVLVGLTLIDIVRRVRVWSPINAKEAQAVLIGGAVGEA